MSRRRIVFWMVMVALILSGWGVLAVGIMWVDEMGKRERLDRAK